MKSIKICLVVFILFNLFSCEPTRNDRKIVQLTSEELTPETVLKGDTINVKGLLGSIKSWKVFEDKILLVDIATEKLVHIYSFPTFKFIGDYVDKGKGPGEVLDVWDMQIADDGFWILDGNLKKLVHFKINNLINGNSNIPPQEIKIDNESFTTDFIWLDDSTLLTSYLGQYPEVLSISRLNDESYKKHLGSYPELNSSNIPVFASSQAFSGKIAFNVDSPRVFKFCQYADCIISMNKDGSDCKYILGPQNNLPKFAVGGGAFMPNEGTIIGYYSITASKNFIFAVYSGKPFLKANGGFSLRVFDWSGHLRKVYRFDRLIEYVMPLEQTGELFAYSEQLEHNFIKFKLNYQDL